jgi:hypothetical protein
MTSATALVLSPLNISQGRAMTKFMTARDLVNVYFVKPVFQEKPTEPKPAQPKPSTLPEENKAANSFWAVDPSKTAKPEPKAESTADFQNILNEIGCLEKLFNFDETQDDIARKYERKVVSSVSVADTKNRKTRLEKLAEKQRVKESEGINPDHLDVVKYNQNSKGWVVNASKNYVLLKKNETRFLIHTAFLARFLKKRKQSSTTLRTSRDGKKLMMSGVAYPFKAL